jgi:hypothetical protein
MAEVMADERLREEEIAAMSACAEKAQVGWSDYDAS